jgi:hypothetical protein
MQDLSINYVDKMQGLVVLVCYKKTTFTIFMSVSLSLSFGKKIISLLNVFL